MRFLTSPSPTFVRLALLLSLVVLLTSRVMLLVHEFGGHGAPAVAFGGDITSWHLFLFAGGRVSYEIPELSVGARLVIALGGIVLEIGFGIAAFALAARWKARPALAFATLAVGTVLVGHGAIYLSRGAHYGYGDGALLARTLGAARFVVVVPAVLLAIGAALYGGRRLAAWPADILGAGRGPTVGAVLLLFVLAGAVHGSLSFVEVRFFPDARWAAIMEDAAAQQARAELRRQLAEAAKRGEAPPDPAEQQRRLELLEKERRPFPLDPFLYGGIALGLAAGVVRGSRGRANAGATPPTWRTIATLGLALGVAVVVIFVLRRFGYPSG